jgi:hypothetical protein
MTAGIFGAAAVGAAVEGGIIGAGAVEGLGSLASRAGRIMHSPAEDTGYETGGVKVLGDAGKAKFERTLLIKHSFGQKAHT